MEEKRYLIFIIMSLYENSRLYRVFLLALNSIVYLFYRKPIYIKAWVRISFGKVVPRNWGDDINVHLVRLISKRDVIVSNSSLFHIFFKPSNYICIGSVLGWFEDEKTEIWGAGFISEDVQFKILPKKIHSVRGKSTRDRLLEMNVNCPKVYGDPALLLSMFYKPTLKKKYKMGIVPHFADYDNPCIVKFLENHRDCIRIKLRGYKKWTDVIDQICSCDFIVSSSLHGLITSDSYGIPNEWVSFSNNIEGGNFKFIDYFSSVCREEKQPIFVSNHSILENIYNNHPEKCSCQINIDSLLKSCPFYNV